MATNNELITAINILSDNVTLDTPSESICIDTQNNRIGILTDNPQFQLDISGSSDSNLNGIGTPKLTLTSNQGINTQDNINSPLFINANTVIKETLDVCKNAIFLDFPKILEYSIKETFNLNLDKSNYYLEFGVFKGYSINLLSKYIPFNPNSVA